MCEDSRHTGHPTPHQGHGEGACLCRWGAATSRRLGWRGIGSSGLDSEHSWSWRCTELGHVTHFTPDYLQGRLKCILEKLCTEYNVMAACSMQASWILGCHSWQVDSQVGCAIQTTALSNFLPWINIVTLNFKNKQTSCQRHFIFSASASDSAFQLFPQYFTVFILPMYLCLDICNFPSK